MTDRAKAPGGHTFSVRRMQTHDGPGLRTSVFMKGCALHCAWCHNPEALSPAREVWWLRDACIGCLTCVESCPHEALDLTAAGMRIDRERCEGCYTCVDACPADAMEALRHDWTLAELLDEVRRDEAFYADGGGGVTVSGGEPLAQWRFVRDILRGCHEAGIHTALDTCGEGPAEGLKEILPFTRLVLYDMKLMDADVHTRWTGADNRLILDNLRMVADEVRKRRNLELWIRTPLIPGATDFPENISAIARFIHEEIEDVVSRWELCTFNPLCDTKYRKLGKGWEFDGMPLLARTHAQELRHTALENCTIPPERIVLKGRLAGKVGAEN
jgi:pyruvate formate lyase activating enzyme